MEKTDEWHQLDVAVGVMEYFLELPPWIWHSMRRDEDICLCTTTVKPTRTITQPFYIANTIQKIVRRTVYKKVSTYAHK